MSTPPRHPRPLSPHLQVYRPQLTSVLSILHRASGIILSLAAVLIALWLWSLSSGQQEYHTVQGLLQSVLGRLVLYAWTLCTFYHLGNGIRHLVWDAGYGLGLTQAYWSGRITVAAAVLLSVLVWWL